MLDELERQGELYQMDAADGIAAKFGPEFNYTNENGNPAISKRAGRWVDDDAVCHADHSAHLADDPLDLVALEAPFHLAVERDPAAFHPGVTFPSGTCTLFSSTCAIALAMSESSRGTAASLTLNSLATALTL
jgi:hypothetical protein